MLLALFLLATCGTLAAPSAEVRSPEIQVRPGRIVSGWEASEGDFPYAINLRMSDEEGFVSSCTGAIIHNEWGLTAGHCTTLRVTIIVAAGSVSILTPKIIFETTEYYHPPDHVEGVYLQVHDISLIKFNRFVEYTDLIQPIRLQPSIQKDMSYENVLMRVPGWGLNATNYLGGEFPDVLNWVYVTGLSIEECRYILFNPPILADSTVCSMAYNVSSQSPCDGDSGAPLVIEDVDGKLTSIGVASWSSGAGCEAYSPSGYIRPGYYQDWFYEVTGISFDWDPESIALKKEEENFVYDDKQGEKVQVVESVDA